MEHSFKRIKFWNIEQIMDRFLTIIYWHYQNIVREIGGEQSHTTEYGH